MSLNKGLKPQSLCSGWWLLTTMSEALIVVFLLWNAISGLFLPRHICTSSTVFAYPYPNGVHNIPSESDRFTGDCFVIHQLKKVAAELLRVVHQVV